MSIVSVLGIYDFKQAQHGSFIKYSKAFDSYVIHVMCRKKQLLCRSFLLLFMSVTHRDELQYLLVTNTNFLKAQIQLQKPLRKYSGHFKDILTCLCQRLLASLLTKVLHHATLYKSYSVHVHSICTRSNLIANKPTMAP